MCVDVELGMCLMAPNPIRGRLTEDVEFLLGVLDRPSAVPGAAGASIIGGPGSAAYLTALLRGSLALGPIKEL